MTYLLIAAIAFIAGAGTAIFIGYARIKYYTLGQPKDER